MSVSNRDYRFLMHSVVAVGSAVSVLGVNLLWDRLFCVQTQTRKDPLIGLQDKIVLRGDQVMRLSPSLQLFADEEIVSRERVRGLGSFFGFSAGPYVTMEGKLILQQSGASDSSSAASAMFVADYGKRLGQIGTGRLKDSPDFLDHHEVIEHICSAGLSPICSPVRDLVDLRQLLNQTKGSAIVSLGFPGFLFHYVVVDAVLPDFSVKIRDPYHGWAITVRGDAFLEKWKPEALNSVAIHIRGVR